jgi:GTP pyrophosphokinase
MKSLLTVADASAPPEIARAREFAVPFISDQALDTGENTLAHADAVAAILKTMGASDTMQSASYLVYACEHLNRPLDVLTKTFGNSLAQLAMETTRLVGVQRQARAVQANSHSANPTTALDNPAVQTENVRKMLLAFSRDLRVVMLRLASRLQTLRHYAATKQTVSPSLARESLNVFAPLANRLGIWQIKWELEDLAFRCLEPETYKQIAGLLSEKRILREVQLQQLREQLQADLNAAGVVALVQGRPKHIYSIVRKMRGKSLGFDQVLDVRALRVIVPDVAACYAALAWIHSHLEPLPDEFDDYIAKPKVNGYQSLHTVVLNSAQPVEIQIRTQAMHDHAEQGVAAHWAYKEAGAKGYAGVIAGGSYDAKIAVLRQLLAWERDLSGAVENKGLLDDRIYVLTPDAAIIELPQGGTPVDFAYHVHTNLGHRCRGARVDGVMVPLNTPLKNGQTVDVMVAKDGASNLGPSRDWLNPELGYLAGARSRAKVRAWFNALASHETVARGREAVERLLQREGKTALKLDDLAAQLGFDAADDLFAVVGKDEFSLRQIEAVLKPPETLTPDEFLIHKKTRQGEKAAEKAVAGGVLVVGMDSLMTQLAKCCKPAPPDAIGGFVTRGKGVSIHRADCTNFRELQARSSERVIAVAWSAPKASDAAVYPVDVAIEAADRQGLLRDISEVFAKDKMNVIGVQTQSVKTSRGETAWMTFTVQVADSAKLMQVLSTVAQVAGVRSARRR